MLNVSPQMTLEQLLEQLPEDHTAVQDYKKLLSQVQAVSSSISSNPTEAALVGHPDQGTLWAEVNGAQAPIHPSLLPEIQPEPVAEPDTNVVGQEP